MVRQASPRVVRVRIAPSPTGIPHIGNTRTALFNYVFARHNKGRFILRIEDTDQARIIPGTKEAIEEILNWLGLYPDETYIQSERLKLYQEASQILHMRGFARMEEGAMRFIVPKDKTIEWEDKVGNKKISFKTQDIDDFVILKSDGFPTYHLANVVDDHEMEITHVIRGDEWISSTPKHLLLYQAFGWEPPVFAHLPLILGPDRTKLSKRHGAKSVLVLRDEGYLKEVLLNFMALLGWNPGGDREIMTMEEMIELFDLKDVNTNSPIFDINKLTWLNSYYIRKLSVDELISRIMNHESGIRDIERDLLIKLIPLAQTRMKTLRDFEKLVLPFFKESKVKLTDKEKDVAIKLKDGLLVIKQWDNQIILGALQKVLKSEGIRMSVVYKIFTGQETGLPLPDTLAILGKEHIIGKLTSK